MKDGTEIKDLSELNVDAWYWLYDHLSYSQRFNNWRINLSNIYAYVYKKAHGLDRLKEKEWKIIDDMEERSTIIDYLNLIDYSMDINGNIYNEKDQCVFANSDEGTLGNSYDENGIYIGKL